MRTRLLLQFFFLAIVSALLHTSSQQRPEPQQPPPNRPRTKWIPYTDFPQQIRDEFPNVSFDEPLRLRMFKIIEFPLNYLKRLPVVGNYLLFLPYPDSTHFDYCQFAQQKMQRYGIDSSSGSCSSFFCENEEASRMLGSNNATERSDYAAIFNYCLYCSVKDSTNVTQVREFLAFQERITNSIRTCSYAFQFFDTKHCGDTGFTLLSNETIVMDDYNQNKPFLCFCPDINSYGAYCDAFTATLNFTNYYVKNWIFAAIALGYLLAIVPCIILPSCAACLYNIRSRQKRRKLTVKYFLAVVFDLRHQCAVFLLLSFILFIVTQVLAVFEVWEKTLWFRRAGLDSSNFRVVGSVCLGLSYAALLVMWASYYSIAQTLRKQLTWQAKLLMVLLYCGLMVTIVLLVILRALGMADSVVFAVVTSICVAYLIIFPAGFTVYGLALYCIMRRAGTKISFRNFKISRFMLISNVEYFGCFICYILVAIGYTVGWDYLGYALGSHRNVFLDVPNLVVSPGIMYMLFMPSHVLLLYGPVLPTFIRKKLAPAADDNDDNKTSTENKRATKRGTTVSKIDISSSQSPAAELPEMSPQPSSTTEPQSPDPLISNETL